MDKNSNNNIGLHGDDLATFRSTGSERVPAVVEADIERAATVHVLLELGNSGLCLSNLAELHNTAAFRPGTLEEDLCLLDLSRSLEKLDEILVCGRPRQVADHDLLARFSIETAIRGSGASDGSAERAPASESVALLVRTRVIGIDILTGEVTACSTTCKPASISTASASTKTATTEPTTKTPA